MPRRVSLPEADDLFRPTVVRGASDDSTGEPAAAVRDEAGTRDSSEPRPSGRVRHDEKMTVYISSDELLDIEDARLTLRRRHALAADRGRVVRAAVALALVDLEKRGEHSDLVTLLRQQ